MISPASPADRAKIEAGVRELERLGFNVAPPQTLTPAGYFAGTTEERFGELLRCFQDSEGAAAAIAARGGYGSAYLLDRLQASAWGEVKPLVGYSDITALQIFLWQSLGWVTFYGPMVASGFGAGAGNPGGYDQASFLRALTETGAGWSVELQGSTLAAGEAEGVLLGGCMTIVESTLATPWELDTAGAILVLEDRAMKPYQVDRVLMHLKQAGKLSGVRGVILGEFPDCEPAVKGSPEVVDVCRRILGALGVPVVWGAPVGHTPRPMLTLPLGVRARLRAAGPGYLDILEPAVRA
ncbi:MAG: LD-carboxypeptidase [Candidatus Acidiferrales bacterium]